MKTMNLITDELRRMLPALYQTEQHAIGEKIAYGCFFTPDSNWYWYPVEYDGRDYLYGLIAGAYLEFGSFSLSELEQIRGPWGLPIERDRFWKPTPCLEIIKRHQDREGAALLLP